jgi:PhoH-like ATPase
VVLVSKDINMRVKARALGLATDDYQNDKTLEDWTCSTPARSPCRPTSGSSTGKTVESWQSGSNTFYRISGPSCPTC